MLQFNNLIVSCVLQFWHRAFQLLFGILCFHKGSRQCRSDRTLLCVKRIWTKTWMSVIQFKLYDSVRSQGCLILKPFIFVLHHHLKLSTTVITSCSALTKSTSLAVIIIKRCYLVNILAQHVYSHVMLKCCFKKVIVAFNTAHSLFCDLECRLDRNLMFVNVGRVHAKLGGFDVVIIVWQCGWWPLPIH